MTQNTNEKCHGCYMECEYGSLRISTTGHYLPTLNGQVYTSYWISRSQRKFIAPDELRTAQQATDVAREIAKRCTRNLSENNHQK